MELAITKFSWLRIHNENFVTARFITNSFVLTCFLFRKHKGTIIYTKKYKQRYIISFYKGINYSYHELYADCQGF